MSTPICPECKSADISLCYNSVNRAWEWKCHCCLDVWDYEESEEPNAE